MTSSADEPPPDPPQDPFERAYRAYLVEMKNAWAEVDIDAMVSALADYDRRGGEAGNTQSTLGTLGTGGTIATAPCFGSLFCVATTYCYGTLYASQTPE
jgi:hypothetical protein